MELEIRTIVRIEGNIGFDNVTVVITENDLIELAKIKALENVDPSWYDTAECTEIDECITKN